jgi:hypothetical protein
MAEITHQMDEDGHMRQIVTARQLTEILREDGDSLDRPKDFGPDDEWDVEDDDTQQPTCQHDWHYYGTTNGIPDYACQTCGVTRPRS